MAERRRFWLVLALWITLIFLLLLSPSPREWGILGKWLSPRYDLVRPYLEASSHVLLMGILTMILLKGFTRMPRFIALILAVGASLALAVLFECLQNLLPGTFGRSASIDDVWYSLAGILIGGAVGLYRRSRREI